MARVVRVVRVVRPGDQGGQGGQGGWPGRQGGQRGQGGHVLGAGLALQQQGASSPSPQAAAQDAESLPPSPAADPFCADSLRWPPCGPASAVLRNRAVLRRSEAARGLVTKCEMAKCEMLSY